MSLFFPFFSVSCPSLSVKRGLLAGGLAPCPDCRTRPGQLPFLLSPAGCQGLRRPPTAPAGASALSPHQTQGCEMLPRLVEFIRGLCRRGSCILSIARHRAVVPPAEISSIRAPGRMPKGAQALAVFSPLAIHCLPIATWLQDRDGRAGTGPLTVRSTVRYAPAKHHAQAPRRESLVSLLK